MQQDPNNPKLSPPGGEFAWVVTTLKIIFILILLAVFGLGYLVRCATTEVKVKQTYYTYLISPVMKNIPVTVKSVVSLNGCGEASRVGAKYIYNYNGTNPNCGITWDAMIWGRDQVGMPVDSSEYLMLFNEPDRPDQANIPPAEAVDLLYQVESIYQGVKFVSPAPSQGSQT